MKEKLYSIPVNDAFNSECECPICAMYKTLEDDAVDYTMGPSYMEDDTRAMTDELGFCDKHIRMVYHKDNRLGMAWVMKTHFDKTINDVRKNMPSGPAKMLKKGIENSSVIKYLEEFVSLINELYITNLERVRDDVAWFINKFDYKYQDEPWYSARDSVIRSMVKASSVILDE